MPTENKHCFLHVTCLYSNYETMGPWCTLVTGPGVRVPRSGHGGGELGPCQVPPNVVVILDTDKSNTRTEKLDIKAPGGTQQFSTHHSLARRAYRPSTSILPDKLIIRNSMDPQNVT